MTTSPLAALQVIHRLEVGPPRLDPHRVVTPYTVHTGDGASDSAEMSYRFDEPVFDPDRPADRNLAAVMTAQVALNYGLFCKEIVFRGPFDAHDRAFLEEMARNTAQEIYVNKLLTDNPFLIGPARDLPVERRESYLQARLELTDDEGFGGGRRWDTSAGRYVVLSSGGKESLLSLALLQEIGQGVDPIFVNESGRHWFTALNAFRKLREDLPGTARVWTSADRVFNWMLRHLPFVRQDFARVRADIYPIRLWTVAVFVFGVLPLMRRRGAARLVIGDEFDTTQRSAHHGIPHYNGLYDQSRYFDEALTAYYQRKGWSLSQLSLVRPLSELLIEKVLVERYPELQALQVSCHATHTAEERVLPCGRCEKCRRVVGMLVALGADPTRCGYSTEQITDCLAALPRTGLHQEDEGVQQLAHMLAQKGLLDPGGGIGDQPARLRPEVLQLRFEPERSPLLALPPEIRGPIHRILLEHAAGAVQRDGAGWRDVDLAATIGDAG